MVSKILNEYKEKYGKIKLDLACGDNKKGEEYIGVDISNTNSNNIICDLQLYPWPFEDNSIDEVHCSHYIEHIPHDTAVKEALAEANNFDEFKNLYNEKSKLDGGIKFYNEIYRILKPGGKAYIIAPYYTSERAYGDPTHKRVISDMSVAYLNQEWLNSNKLKHYGIIADFDITYSYHISEEMALRSEQHRNKAIRGEWNVVNDIMIELTKRNNE